MSGAEPFILAASAVASAAGAISSGNAQAAAADHQAAVDARNAELANQDAIRAQQTAQIAASDLARSQRRQLADLRANLGSSGLEVSGSPIDVLTDTSIEMALDQRRTAYEGDVKARDGSIEAQNYRDSANAAKLASRSARSGGYASAGAALLSGGSKSYAAFDKAGYFD